MRPGVRIWGPIAAVLVALFAPPAVAENSAVRATLWAAEDADTLRRAAPRLVDSALSTTFDAMEGRIPAYADWVYGWLSSLITAKDLAYVGLKTAAREVYHGRVPDFSALYAELAALVERRFDETVVMSGSATAAAGAGWSRSMARLMALDQRLAAERGERIRRVAVEAGVTAAPLLSLYGQPLLDPSIGASQPPPDLVERAIFGVEDSPGGTTEGVLIRSLRPLVTRAISAASRVVLAPTIAGLIASPMLGANGTVLAGATLLGVSAGIWGVDYALNELDGAITRPTFEAELRALIRSAHARASRLARDHAEFAVCDALVGGCPPPRPPSSSVAGAGRPG